MPTREHSWLSTCGVGIILWLFKLWVFFGYSFPAGFVMDLFFFNVFYALCWQYLDMGTVVFYYATK
jgi:hypothetical protein